MERSPSAHRRGRAVASLAAFWWAAGAFTALAQVSPCTSSAGQLPGQSVISGSPPVFYNASDLSAGGSGNAFSVNTNAQGAPGGSANATFESPGKICLGPGFQAAAPASGTGFHAFIGTIAPSFTVSQLSNVTLPDNSYVYSYATITTNAALSGTPSATGAGYPSGLSVFSSNASPMTPSSSETLTLYIGASNVATGTYVGTIYITVGTVTLPFSLVVR